MTQAAIVTKWKFIVEFEDDESKEISGTLGQADTQEECEASIEDEVQYHRSHGRTTVNLEAGEVCAACGGDGHIPAGNGGQVICQACGGHLGPITPFIHLRI
jgi:DnaJ-class molecular chaperone